MGDGYYFAGDYPEAYPDKLEDLQNLLRRQLNELEKNDRAQDAATIGFLRGRRSSRTELVQIEIAHLNPPRVLVANGEVILDAAALPESEVTATGSDDRDERCGRFVRRYRSEIPARIADQGLPNTLAVTASVGKGIGGPDSVSSPLLEASRNFRDYHLPDAEPASGPRPIVAIVDTGIPGDHDDGLPTMIRTDGWLDDVPRSADNRDLLDYLPQPDGYLDYQAGHGTFVAGIVQRVAPTAEIRMYRAADTDGFADDVAIANALRRAAAGGAHVINVSLGMVTRGNVPPPALKDAIEEITANGVVIVAAAGNFGDETTCWPAAFAEVVAVGALIENEEVSTDASTVRTGKFEAARWSSKGGYIDFWTVAEGVRSTFVTGRESPLFDNQPTVFPQDAWALWSGTSFAAPQIAGAIARIQQEKGKTPREALEFLREQGAQVKDLAGNFKSGRGLRILSGIRIPPPDSE